MLVNERHREVDMLQYVRQYLHVAWENIAPAKIRRLINSMQQHYIAIIAHHGGHITYCVTFLSDMNAKPYGCC